MKNPLKINLLMLSIFLSLLFVSCSNSEENNELKENLEEVDMSFMYKTSFMDKFRVNQIEVELNTDGDTIYTLSFDQELYTKAAVAPGESEKCYSQECVIKELEECFEKGGTQAVVEKKLVGVKVSCK